MTEKQLQVEVRTGQLNPELPDFMNKSLNHAVNHSPFYITVPFALQCPLTGLRFHLAILRSASLLAKYMFIFSYNFN